MEKLEEGCTDDVADALEDGVDDELGFVLFIGRQGGEQGFSSGTCEDIGGNLAHNFSQTWKCLFLVWGDVRKVEPMVEGCG